MAFLDNSGDIILDAVLTDAGRQRMARGEFKIVKYAFGDEEINYELFNESHPSGSAFADLEIMQTPILEAFTNNTSLMKSKLITINRNNILHMPIFRINPVALESKTSISDVNQGFLVTAGRKTTTLEGSNAAVNPGPGWFYGDAANTLDRAICIDQGLDTNNNPPITAHMPDDLIETAFLIRADHRLLRLSGYVDAGPRLTQLRHSFVDDDGIASYYVSSTEGHVKGPRTGTRRNLDTRDNDEAKLFEVFNGPVGQRLMLVPSTSIHIQSDSSLFDELGSTVSSGTLAFRGYMLTDYKYIDTLINVVGVTTGYSIDIPIRIVKIVSGGYVSGTS
tara:strand:- start:13187 stop:14191 length:1005 start_codon:yes stop_codon:yes gene_type:complete